ncbi:MAG: hypothetical protein ACI8QZ_002016 [Chlamydiales bacterium]|jgi:hypothetical protein
MARLDHIPRLLAVAGLLLTASCSPSPTGGAVVGGVEDVRVGGSDLNAGSLSVESTRLLDRMQASHRAARFSGLRRIELHFVDDGRDEVLEYLEEVGCDGEGQFALDTVELLQGPDDVDLFMILQDSRQVFTFEFRDFRITDRHLVLQNYTIAHESNADTVAGVSCLRLRFERQDSPLGGYYRVWVEPETGLTLRWEQVDRNGVLLGEMEFESIDFTPDLSNFQLIRRNFDGRTIDLNGDLVAQVGFDVLTPSLLPSGYRIESGRVVADGQGNDWFKRVYTDGVSRMALLHRKPEEDLDHSHGGHLGTVQSMPVGPWNLVTGTLKGWRLIIMGQIDPDELYQTVQSAF